MSLDYLFKLIKFIINKEKSGKSITPPDYNVLLDFASNQLFSIEYEKIRKYAVANETSLFEAIELGSPLTPFLDSLSAATLPSSGKLPKPPLFVYPRAMRGLYDSKPKKIDIISSEYMNMRLTNPLSTPLTDEPAAEEKRTHIQIYPKSMTEVVLVFLRRPKKPWYEYTKNDTTDLPEYVSLQEVLGEAVITVTGAGADGDNILVKETSGTSDILLASVNSETGDTVTSMAGKIVEDINRRNTAHGFTAELTSTDGEVKVFAPTGTGSDGNTKVLSVTAGGTSAATVTTAFVASGTGVTGSTQLEWEPDKHNEIAMIILSQMGFNLSNEMLASYKKAMEIESV